MCMYVFIYIVCTYIIYCYMGHDIALVCNCTRCTQINNNNNNISYVYISYVCRWCRHINPDLKKDEWTQEEDEKLKDLALKYNKKGLYTYYVYSLRIVQF